MTLYTSGRQGFTLIELLVVMAVLSVIIGLSLLGIREYAAHQQLRTAEVEVLSILREVRQGTLAAETENQYGVVIGTSTITQFDVVPYDPDSPSNRVHVVRGVTLQPALSLATTTVIFARLTGEPSVSGHIDIVHPRVVESKRIFVRENGIVESLSQ